MLSQSKSQASKARVPREGGDPEVCRTERQLALIWIPAFAGNAGEIGEHIRVLGEARDE